MAIELKQGLDLPISGQPNQDIKAGPRISKVGLVDDDYVGMKPSMQVAVGDLVKRGQVLFSDKKSPGVQYTSPVAGEVTAINRGEKRKFESIEIAVKGNEQVSFSHSSSLGDLTRSQVQELLVASGLWTALRTRPFSRVPALDSEPNSLFVTAMDTNPLAADPELIIGQKKEQFVAGLLALSKLTRGKTFVCTRFDSRIPDKKIPNVEFEQFKGPHPAGLVGTHIHFLDPVGPKKTVWHIGYQDVIAVGQLFSTGELNCERVISIAGPAVKSPGLYLTTLGACLDELVADNLTGSNVRVVSGSILNGRKTSPRKNYLGRYHNQVSALAEGNEREFLGWQKPGFDKFSITRVYGGSWLKNKLFPLTTNTGGSKRAMVPIGSYERVMPLRMLPTQLLRALLVRNSDQAQSLGCLELDEEDLGLCTYVCPGKYDYGSVLRENLSTIEKEG
jgi:Na+-transporting NADH:ubiquinone oxidoreductase subunit A